MADELILVVDDEELVCRQAELALRKSNYRTLTAFNGQQALAVIRETPPDLLLSDIRMPDIDGLQLHTTARKIQPDLLTVLMTGHGTIDVAIKALQLGIAGFLQKPFTGNELEHAVEDAFAKSRTLREAIRLRLLSPLLEARRYLISELDLPNFCRSLVETTAKETGSDYCAIFLPDEPAPVSRGAEIVGSLTAIQPYRPTLRPVATYVNVKDGANVFSGRNFPAARVASRALEVERTLSLRRAAGTDSVNSDSYIPGVVIAVPMIAGGRALGALLVGRTQVEQTFSVGERELYEVLAGQLASILENLRLYRILKEREERLQMFIGRFVSTEEEERQQLAVRLQNDLMPLLTTSRQNIQSYLTKIRPAAGGDELLQAEKRLQTAINAARRLTNDLRPTNLDEFGLSAALRQYVRDFYDSAEGSSRVTFRLEGPEAPRLDSAIEIALFRACQEAITNAIRHAPGSAIEVAVRVTTQRNKPVHLQLQVHDSGKGFDVQAVKAGEAARQVGLLAMQERVTLVGGRCQIDSSPTRGTTVTLDYDLAG